MSGVLLENVMVDNISGENGRLGLEIGALLVLTCCKAEQGIHCDRRVMR